MVILFLDNSWFIYGDSSLILTTESPFIIVIICILYNYIHVFV